MVKKLSRRACLVNMNNLAYIIHPLNTCVGHSLFIEKNQNKPHPPFLSIRHTKQQVTIFHLYTTIRQYGEEESHVL